MSGWKTCRQIRRCANQLRAERSHAARGR